ncbi:MAG: type II secretion system protein [Planctomycetota bacterium]
MNHPNLKERSGFTLTELLLVMAIILVLTTMALGVMQGAQEDARQVATESRIQIIESIMQQEMENYEVRRLPFSNADLEAFVSANRITGVPVRVQVKNLRRRIMADIIRSEMPSFFLNTTGNFANNPDLGVFPTQSTAALGSTAPYDLPFKDWLDANDPVYGYDSPVSGVLLSDYLAEDRHITGRIRYWQKFNNVINPSPGNANFNNPGEYLYRLLEQIDIDGTSALEALGPAAVGDPDSDGNPDIIDEWGQSMQFRVLQVGIDEVISKPDEDVFNDVDDTLLDWNFEDPTTLLPLGYDVINPTIPRSISKIRIQVVSTKLDSYTQ